MKRIHPLGREKLALGAILLVSLFLNLFGLWWGMPNYYNGWAADEIVPGQVQRGIAAAFSKGWNDIYPPFHYYLLTVFYSPVFLYQRIHPLPSDDLDTALFYWGRILSVLMGCGIVLLVYLCGREIFDGLPALIAAGLTACIAPFVYYAKTVNTDVPYLFWVMASLLFFIRILKHHRLGAYLGFALTAALAVCTKDQAFAFYVLAPIPILWSRHAFEKQRTGKASWITMVINRKNLAALGAGALAFVVIQNFLLNWDGFIAHMKFITGPAKIYDAYARTAAGHAALAWQSVKQIRFSLGWPSFLLCSAGLGYALLHWKKNRLLLALLIPAVSYNLFFIHVIRHDFDRYFLAVCFILALFGGKIAADAIRSLSRGRIGGVIVLVLVVVYGAWYALSIDLVMIHDSRYAAESWIRANIPPGASIVLADDRTFLPREYRWDCRHCTYAARYLTLDKLRNLNPDYLVVNADLQRRMNADFYAALKDESSPYAQIFGYRWQSKWLLLDRDDMYKNGKRAIVTNLDKINPHIEIFRRKPLTRPPEI